MEFKPWPKIARLNRDITITEKIDGTNAAIIITADPYGGVTGVGAQSRNRVITPADDNFGFARWVEDNAYDLALVLGPGYHYGEWWGKGIQRGYGLKRKKFSLFNTSRWGGLDMEDLGLGVVPILYEGPFSLTRMDRAMHVLRVLGSQAAPGFKPAEGIVVYHHAANQMFKMTLENDEAPKGAAA